MKVDSLYSVRIILLLICWILLLPNEGTLSAAGPKSKVGNSKAKRHPSFKSKLKGNYKSRSSSYFNKKKSKDSRQKYNERKDKKRSVNKRGRVKKTRFSKTNSKYGRSKEKRGIVSKDTKALKKKNATQGYSKKARYERKNRLSTKVIVHNKKQKVIFGKVLNQINHAFRHTDALGLERKIVKDEIKKNLNQFSSKIIEGKPYNKIVMVKGKKIQYTAYKLKDGTINVGRIHGVK